MLNQKHISSPTLLALAAILLIGGLVYYFYYDFSARDEGLLADYQNASSLYFEGEDGAIVALEDILSQEPSKDLEGSIRVTLAFAYMEKDVAKGIWMLKEVAADATLEPKQRADAIVKMADIIMLTSRPGGGELVEEIFSGDPYETFRESKTQPADSNILTAVRRLYGYASTIHVLPISEYRSAEWYALRVMNSRLDKNFKLDNPEDELILKSESHLLAANDAFEEYQPNGSRTELGYAKWVKGVTLGILSEIDDMPSLREDAKKAFKDSLALLNESSDRNVSYVESNKLWGSFYYAAFLSRAYGISQETEIKALLAGISSLKDGDRPGLVRYLERLGETPAPGGMRAYDYQSAIALAKIDSKFAQFLKDLGWEI